MDRINIGKIFESWDIHDDEDTIMDVIYNHDTDLSYNSLGSLGNALKKAYHPYEIPNLVRAHSDVLGCSILDYLSLVEEGATYIMEEINKEWR